MHFLISQYLSLILFFFCLTTTSRLHLHCLTPDNRTYVNYTCFNRLCASVFFYSFSSTYSETHCGLCVYCLVLPSYRWNLVSAPSELDQFTVMWSGCRYKQVLRVLMDYANEKVYTKCKNQRDSTGTYWIYSTGKLSLKFGKISNS